MASPLLKRYSLALQRYKWAGLASFLAVVGASGVVALQPPPPIEYYSEGILVNNAPLVAFTATGVEVQQQGQGIIDEDLLLSDLLLEQVSLELANRGINIDPDQIKANSKIGVSNNDAGGSRVVVRFIGADPEETEVVLNLMFQGMIELSRVTNKARLQAIITALQERLPGVEAELRQAEQLLGNFDRVEGYAIQAAQDGSLLGSITGGQAQFRQNELTRAGLLAQMQSLQNQLGMNPDEAYASSALSADPIIASLRAQIYDIDTQVQQLVASDYRPEHPAVRELQRNRDSSLRLLQDRAVEILGGNGQGNPFRGGANIRFDSNLDPARAALANQLVTLRTQVDAISQQQQTLQLFDRQLRQQYARIPNTQLDRDRLAYQVALKKALFDQIQAKLVDAESAEAETVSSLTVATPPFTVTATPETPNSLVVLLAGGLIGLVAGGGLIFLLDLLDGTVRTSDDLVGLLREQEVPIMGIIPLIKVRPANAAPILVQADSPYHENYERFLSKLRLVGAENSVIGPRVVLLTSTQSNEGKSVSAYNLAIAAARAGRRTLLVEADLRSPTKIRYLGLTEDPQILIEPLRYYGGKLGDSIRMVPFIENLYVCPSPGPQRQAAAVLESSEMRRFLEDARGRFDMVILDTPSLSRCDDALLLETQADGLLLVTRPGVTEKAVLTTALEELELNEDIEFFGSLINGADELPPENEDDLPEDDLEDELMLDEEFGQVSVGGSIDF